MKQYKYNVAFLLSTESTQKVVNFGNKVASEFDLKYRAESDLESEFYPHISIYKFLATRDTEEQMTSSLGEIKNIPLRTTSIELGASRKKGYLYYKLNTEDLLGSQKEVLEGLKNIEKDPLDRYKQHETEDSIALSNYEKYKSFEVLDNWNPHITICQLKDESLVEEVRILFPINKTNFTIEKVQLYAEGIGTVYSNLIES